MIATLEMTTFLGANSSNIFLPGIKMKFLLESYVNILAVDGRAGHFDGLLQAEEPRVSFRAKAFPESCPLWPQ